MFSTGFVSAGIIAGGLALPKKIFANPSQSGLIRPAALKLGDTIGIVAPGTAVSDPDDIEKAREAMEMLGLKYKLGRNIRSGSGYKTRTASERIDDIHAFLKDDDVSGIICIRGGYGSCQLLDKLDYGLFKKHPKVFLGFSDITAMHLAISRNAGLVTFHGPMLLSALNKYSVDYLKKALFNTIPIGEIVNPATSAGSRNSHHLRVLKPGKATGQLIGGNLSIVSSLMGTPYEIDTKGKILFIEDVGEEPYRIDRMLVQLKLAGKFRDAAGIVIGECSECEYTKASHVWDHSLGEVLDRVFEDASVPVVYGYMFGHTTDQITLPVGVTAELDADNQTFKVTECGVK